MTLVHFSYDCCYTTSAKLSSSTKTIRPIGPQTLTIWPSTEKFCWPLLFVVSMSLFDGETNYRNQKNKDIPNFPFLPKLPYSTNLYHYVLLTSPLSISQLYHSLCPGISYLLIYWSSILSVSYCSSVSLQSAPCTDEVKFQHAHLLFSLHWSNTFNVFLLPLGQWFLRQHQHSMGFVKDAKPQVIPQTNWIRISWVEAINMWVNDPSSNCDARLSLTSLEPLILKDKNRNFFVRGLFKSHHGLIPTQSCFPFIPSLLLAALTCKWGNKNPEVN